MPWTDHLADLANALTDASAFGEAVTLPNGATVPGIFRPVGNPSGVDLTDITGVRLGQQPNPTVRLREVDVIGLAENELVILRGEWYRVTRIDHDNSALAMLELMPETVTDIPETQRWQ